MKRIWTAGILIMAIGCAARLILASANAPQATSSPQIATGRRDIRDFRRPGFGERGLGIRANKPRRLNSSPGYLTWAYALQGDREDEARGTFSTADGGVIFWGDTRILGGPSQAWMSKLSSKGGLEWSRVYDAGDGTLFNEVTRTADGGFVAAGRIYGGYALIAKLTPAGLPEWGCVYGGISGYEEALSVQQCSDGGYIVAGITTEYVTSDLGDWDFFVSKLTASGDLEWSYVLRGPGDEADWMNEARNVTIRPSLDGGYFLAGDSTSYGAGGSDIWIFKLSSAGDIVWQKTYGGAGSETFPNSGPHFVTTPDGGLVVACTTSSFGSSNDDGWLFRLSPGGDIVWQRRIGGPRADSFKTIQPTSDGGFILGGQTTSFPPDGFWHGWLVKIDAQAAIEWQSSYGKGLHFDIQGLGQGTDGSYSAGGVRTPNLQTIWYWDVGRDAFLMKLSGGGTIGPAGTGFVTVSDATVTDTDAIPRDTVISRLPGSSTGSLVLPSSTDVTPQEELLSWGGVQPPLGVTLSSAINRGLFKGEAFVTLEWNPNPWNGTFELAWYAIYRSSGNTFARIATVSSNALTYVDPNLGLADTFAYFIKAVDADGNESPPSATVHN